MVCGSSYYINNLSAVASDILIGDTRIKFSSSIRNLGLLIDDKLCWKEHVNEICRRANSLMYRLRRLRASTTFNLRKHLIQALLWPIIDYCSLAYYNISKDQDIMLQRVVNTGIRYIYDVTRDEHITQYRRQLSWISHVDCRFYFSATMFYKINQKINQSGQPNYLANFFLRRVSNRPIRGEVKLLIIPKHDGKALRKSFHITTAYIWCSLSANIRNSPIIASFRTSLYNSIFNLDATSSFHQYVFNFRETF